MAPDLGGKVVLVTGASGGIGSAIARAFVAEGAKVILHYHHNGTKAQALYRELTKAPTEVLVQQADLRNERQAKRLFARALKHFGRVDTLIANAGWWEMRPTPLHQMSLRHWEHTLRGVLTATFLTTREFLRIVARQKRGNAVLIASTAAMFGESGHADYAAAKAGIAYGLIGSLKNELARLAPHTKDYCGGRMNCISPGWTLVPRNEAKLREAATVRKVIATMALRQIARPEDVAHAAVFLASDGLARHITGQNVVIAGGMEGRILWEPGEIDPEAV